MDPSHIATGAANVTERVMSRIRQNLQGMDVQTYNRIYESVMEEMVFQFPPDSGVPVHPSGGGMLISTKRK